MILINRFMDSLKRWIWIWISSIAKSILVYWIVATLRDSNTDRIWNLQNLREEPKIITGHQGKLTDIAISPDSRWLVTGSEDKTARVWDLKNLSNRPVVLGGHNGVITSVAISPDSRLIVTGSWDNTAKMWLLQPDDLISQGCKSAGRNLTREEWKQYVGPNDPYQKTCPEFD